jgi:hypothetical protein
MARQRPVPALQTFSHVGKRTQLWWLTIGKNITSFAELEQGVIDWAVHFADDTELWQAHFGRDLKGLVPVLRRALQKAGLNGLSEPTKKTVESSLTAVEKLTTARNYVAHLRLCFHAVPLYGTATRWVQTASHVEGRLHDGEKFVLKQRNLEWLRGTEKAIRSANAGPLCQCDLEQLPSTI